MNLRQLARGKPCMVRSVLCNSNPETTVLAHFRLMGVSGMGMKSPDTCAAWACSDCHDLIDGRRSTRLHTRDELQLMHLHGVIRTLAELHRMGYALTEAHVALQQSEEKHV
jgi:hypothetical protein